MTRPADLPPPEHWPHGNRSRYVSGCRCEECRRANREYVHKRTLAQIRGDWNGLVDAGEARSHLAALSAQGVGYKTVAAAASIGHTRLAKIMSGRQTKIRARHAKAILAVTVDARADHSFVDAGPTHEAIARLLAAGYTRTAIARALGSTAKVPSLQLKRDRVLARSALAVDRVARKLLDPQYREQQNLDRLQAELGCNRAQLTAAAMFIEAQGAGGRYRAPHLSVEAGLRSAARP